MNGESLENEPDTIRAAKLLGLSVLAAAGIVGGSIALVSSNYDELALVLFGFALVLLLNLYRVWTGRSLVEHTKRTLRQSLSAEWGSSSKMPRQDNEETREA